MFERICTGETTHKFMTKTADDQESTCPECGKAAKAGFAIRVDPEPFADLTSGAEDWSGCVGALVAFLQQFHLIAVANWFESYFVAAHQGAVGSAVARWLRNLRPLHWYQCRVLPGHERLRVDMSKEELARAAQEMARISSEISRNEAAKREANAEFKAVDEALHKELDEVSMRVREGRYETVAVDTIYDLQLGSASRVRRDTGEVISERPLEADERQATLDFNDADKPATVDKGKKPKLRAVNGAAKGGKTGKPKGGGKPKPKDPNGDGASPT